MATSAEHVRNYSGPAVLGYGFRPFFLGGALWAALAVALWLPMLTGHLSLPTAFAPLEWHVHELVYGYVPAVIAGFLLTAVPNWTGRLPVTGTPLLGLFALWLAGRLATLGSLAFGPLPAAIVDLAFLVALAAVIDREILAAGNTRNLKVLALIGLLAIGNAIFHAEAYLGSAHGFATRIGIAGTLLLIMLIGGRIIPSFTRNWLARRGPGRLPTPFDRVDMGLIAVSAIALIAWIAAPEAKATALVCALGALANAYRLTRWAGDRTLAEPLVLILHVAYAFVPMGFALVSLAIWLPGLVQPSGALHGWTTGAIALMTLAVMTRASLGHTGQPLTATRPIALIYVAATLAASARVAVAFGIARSPMLTLSAIAWVLAFGGFVAVYAPLLLARRA